MKKIMLCALVLCTSTATAIAEPLSPVEADRIRISTHLEQVERELRAKDVTEMPIKVRGERSNNIERLHAYRLAGEFPHNTAHPGERVPYFIDRDGRACAVGALIIGSGDGALADRISRTENNARVKEMTIPGLGAWVERSGLSVDECARIQPAYCDESLCGSQQNPVCGKSGTSYWCREVLEQCTKDEYAYDGECIDGGAPDAGPVVVGQTDDDGGGCRLRPLRRGENLGAFALLGLLAFAARRATAGR